MPVAYFDVSAAGVGMEEGLARGRERVAMTTPDETTATAVFEWGVKIFFFFGQQVWCSRQRGMGKRITICWSVYRLPMNMRPRSIDTPSPASP